ncbi:MAG TPA: tripartite tricarboxylate transporter substrate binding protein [Hyphomicrobiaceae bacterium]|jgi:tripartite-type tricarboxylate transporter receptor subunit TctC|nr:tripartite tricarboxylate transporter substrate binding protein [Hyphomicrobiaceae bacterium]
MRTLAMRSLVLALFLLAAGWSPIGAQEWPSRTVTIIVPFIAGSTPDSLARILAEGLQQRLGVAFVVENRAGASGNTGTAAVAKAVPDGHTLGVSIVGPLVINALLFPKMPYETEKDIAPISILASQPSVLVVSPGVAADDIASLLAAIKSAPDKYTYGSIGRGSLSHLAMASLALKAGVNLVHLPFPGSPATVTALLRGDVQMAVMPAGSVVPLAAEGKLRLLAVTSPQRSPLLPALPTLREAGVVGVEADAWVGLIAPAQISEPVLAKIHQQIVLVLGSEPVIEKLKAQLMVPIASSPAAFKAVLRDERGRWAPIIAAGGIKAE